VTWLRRFVGASWCAGGMPRRRDPNAPTVVYRTARAGLRLTRGQRRRLLALLVSAGDVWACVLELSAWRRARQDRPLASYPELCRLLAASGPGTFGELDTAGARSVLRRYADAWQSAAKRRRDGDRTARFPRRRRRMSHGPPGRHPGRRRSPRRPECARRAAAQPAGPRLADRPPHHRPARQGRTGRDHRHAGGRAGHLVDLPRLPKARPQACGAGVHLPALPVHRPPRPGRGGSHRRPLRRRDHASHHRPGWRHAPSRRITPSRCVPGTA
jgi:hypothetical protein